MKICQNDKKLVETVYPASDYVVQFDDYGKKVFLTLKPTHSLGITITRILQCEACQTERAKPDILRRLKNSQDIESIETEARTDIKNRSIAKTIGLPILSKVLGKGCSKCGTLQNVRNDKSRDHLCESCYKEYRRDYMRDLMRAKRETNHVA